MVVTPVILNAAGGSFVEGETDRVVCDAFAATGVEIKLILRGEGQDLEELSEEALAQDPPLIVAGGGDGTVSAVAAVAAGSAKPLGILPLGTLNHFSKDLHIPQEPAGAAKVIAAGHGGLEAGCRRCVGGRRRHVRLTTGDRELDRKTPFVFVGNNQYQMDIYNIGSRESLQDGQMSVYILHRSGRWGVVRLLLNTLLGRLNEASEFESLTTTQLTIETKRKKRLLVALDGEVATMETPLHFKIMPGKLAVLVPPKDADAC